MNTNNILIAIAIFMAFIAGIFCSRLEDEQAKNLALNSQIAVMQLAINTIGTDTEEIGVEPVVFNLEPMPVIEIEPKPEVMLVDLTEASEEVSAEVASEKSEQGTPEESEEKVLAKAETETEDTEGSEPKVFYTIPAGDEPFVLPLLEEGGILEMLKDKNFYHAKAVGGIRPEAEEATEILLGYYNQIPVEKRFTPEEIAAFMIREAKHWSSVEHYSKDNPSGKLVIDLNTVSGSDNGGLQLRSVCYNEVLIDEDGRMPFSDAHQERLKELSLGNADMRKNPLLPMLIFQFWHQRYTVSDSSLAVKAGKFNAGPSGYKRGGGRSYGRGVENTTK
jgi:hypothetical protein